VEQKERYLLNQTIQVQKDEDYTKEVILIDQELSERHVLTKGRTIPLFFTRVNQRSSYAGQFETMAATYGAATDAHQGLGQYMHDSGAGGVFGTAETWRGYDHSVEMVLDSPIPASMYTDGVTKLKTTISITGDLELTHKWVVSKRKSSDDLGE